MHISSGSAIIYRNCTLSSGGGGPRRELQVCIKRYYYFTVQINGVINLEISLIFGFIPRRPGIIYSGASNQVKTSTREAFEQNTPTPKTPAQLNTTSKRVQTLGGIILNYYTSGSLRQRFDVVPGYNSQVANLNRTIISRDKLRKLLVFQTFDFLMSFRTSFHRPR